MVGKSPGSCVDMSNWHCFRRVMLAWQLIIEFNWKTDMLSPSGRLSG